jgi:hypothetical protein
MITYHHNDIKISPQVKYLGSKVDSVNGNLVSVMKEVTTNNNILNILCVKLVAQPGGPI